MSSPEGMRSSSPRQPSARSKKQRIYESLFLLNQGFDHVVALLRGMEKFSIADQESMQSTLAEIEEVRAGVNADFVEPLGDRERFDESRFWKQRRGIDRKWRDPDDVYLEVERREQERKKQGLPPRVGIVPHFVVAEQENCGAQQSKKRLRQRPLSRNRS